MEEKQTSVSQSGGWKRRLAFSAVVSAALAFTLCFFGPLDLFFNNYEEVWFHLHDIIGGVVCTALIVFAAATLAGTLLRGKLHSIYVALLFGGTLGLWVQGSFMNINYGILDGTDVNWGAYTGYGIVNTLIWAVCILLPLLLMLALKEKKMRPVLIFLSCALILMQGTSLVVSRLNYENPAETATLTTDGIWELSRKENTIVFVVDTLDESFYEAMMKARPDYAKGLTGFTHYNNAMPAGSRTLVAMPLILTGIPRTEPGSYAEYIDRIWHRQTTFNDLKKAGFDTRLFTESRFVAPVSGKTVDNLEMATSSVGNHFGLNKRLYKLTLYKYVPHFLKWRFWMTTSGFSKFQRKTEYTVNDSRFYESYQSGGGFTYTDTERCFRLYHMMGAHKPITLRSDGTRSKSRTSIDEQVVGVFHIILDMLDDLREHKVYDKCNIIIMADHGAVDNDQWATLLYKPAGATGALRENSAPVSFLDACATITDLAGGDVSKAGSGRTFTDAKEGEKRTRTMYRNTGSNATLITNEFKTDGDASEPDKMHVVKQYQLRNASDVEAYKLGDTLSFSGKVGTANVYCTHGFRYAVGNFTGIEGHRAQMVIPIKNPPKDGNLTVHLTYRDVQHSGDMVISSGGKQVFKQYLKAHANKEAQTLTFQVPVSTLKDGKLTLDFTFPTVSKAEEKKEEGTRKRSLRVSEMMITAE